MTIEELQKAQEDFDTQNANRLALLKGFESMANIPSLNEALKGRTNRQFDFTSGYQAGASPLEMAKQQLAMEDRQASLADKLAAKQEVEDRKQAGLQAEDPQGKLANSMRTLYKLRGLPVEDGLSPSQMVQLYGKPSEVLQMGLKSDAEKQLIAERAKAQKELIAQRMAGPARGGKQAEALKQGPTEEEKLAKLNAAEKTRFDNILMTTKALDQMEEALKKGESRYSPIGDNQYTLNLSKAAEAFGRMQSGGAINKDEEARFVGLIRSAGDSKEIQMKKLKEFKDEMKSRYQTLGFDPNKSPLFAPKGQPQTAPTGGVINEAVAAPKMPKTVVQNGHTYTWNEATKRYE